MEGLTLAQLQDMVRKGLGGLDSSEMPNSEANRLLNQAFWEQEFSMYFKEKECRYEFDTTKGENMYLIPDEDDDFDVEAIQSVSVLDEDDNPLVMQRMTQQWWDDNYAHEDEDKHGLPTHWTRMDETIIVHPTPDRGDYEIRVYFLKTLKEVTELTDGTSDPDLPRNWHEIVAYGAIWRGHFENGDYNLARQAKNFYVGLVRRAAEVRSKEEGIDRYAGLEVAHDAPSQ